MSQQMREEAGRLIAEQLVESVRAYALQLSPVLHTMAESQSLPEQSLRDMSRFCWTDVANLALLARKISASDWEVPEQENPRSVLTLAQLTHESYVAWAYLAVAQDEEARRMAIVMALLNQPYYLLREANRAKPKAFLERYGQNVPEPGALIGEQFAANLDQTETEELLAESCGRLRQKMPPLLNSCRALPEAVEAASVDQETLALIERTTLSVSQEISLINMLKRRKLISKDPDSLVQLRPLLRAMLESMVMARRAAMTYGDEMDQVYPQQALGLMADEKELARRLRRAQPFLDAGASS